MKYKKVKRFTNELEKTQNFEMLCILIYTNGFIVNQQKESRKKNRKATVGLLG